MDRLMRFGGVAGVAGWEVEPHGNIQQFQRAMAGDVVAM